VHDHSSVHNFHLSGPGADASTPVDFVGDQTFTVTLADGTYFFDCDAHPVQMKGKFTVGAVTTPPPPAAPVKLAGSVGPGSKVALGPLRGLSSGRFAVTVRDRTAADGFRLAGPGVARATGAAFRGTVTWTVKLKPGRYSFGSVRHPKLRRVFTVAA
jgi:hypothetical protein